MLQITYIEHNKHTEINCFEKNVCNTLSNFFLGENNTLNIKTDTSAK